MVEYGKDAAMSEGVCDSFARRWCSGLWRARAASFQIGTALWIVSPHEAFSPCLGFLLHVCRSTPGRRSQGRAARQPQRFLDYRFNLFQAQAFHARNLWSVQMGRRRWHDAARLVGRGYAMETRGVNPPHSCQL
jgi:hypothetical protein